jgi:type I site-specific restriction-modification system R (restriction) subunit
VTTPIEKADANTQAVFGDTSAPTTSRAVEDYATVPSNYEGHGPTGDEWGAPDMRSELKRNDE